MPFKGLFSLSYCHNRIKEINTRDDLKISPLRLDTGVCERE